MQKEKGIIIVVDDRATIVIPASSTLIKLTTTETPFTCIYLSLEDDKIVFSGGAGIIKRIEGEGMTEKIKK